MVGTDEISTDDEGISKSTRLLLNCIAEAHTQLRAITEKLLKCRQLTRCRNNQNLTNTSKHQC